MINLSMTAYISSNSEYQIKEGDLIRTFNGNTQKLGSDFSYVSEETIVKVLKEKKISIKQLNNLDTLVGESILDSLGAGIDLNKEGGRFFALIKRKKGYIGFHSGKILEVIEDTKDKEMGLDFADIDREIDEQYGFPNKKP
ncbi:MAG: hypothetical protein AABW67_04550 [Nanoarchaeota archaeon]